jgi:hypothetical protein
MSSNVSSSSGKLPAVILVTILRPFETPWGLPLNPSTFKRKFHVHLINAQ